LFENGVLRGISGPRRGEVKKEWRKLHNEELQNLFSWPSVNRMTKLRG
jgi:hypothetical protein